jgi:MFS superfamily sulfate permease-like transporter
MLGLQHALAHSDTRADPPTTPISKLLFVIKHLEHSNKVTTILSAVTLAVLIGCRILKQHAVKRPGGRWLRYVPEILLVVAGTTCKLFTCYEVRLAHAQTSQVYSGGI